MVRAIIKKLMSGSTYAGDEGGSAGRMKNAGLDGVTDEQYRKFFCDCILRSRHTSMILHRDCINMQVSDDQGRNMNLVEYISNQGVIAGIKVDAGMANIAGQRFVGAITELPERLKQAKQAGAQFTKFRFAYGPETPRHVLHHGAVQMAIYCLASLEHELVPYPEPELERSLLAANTDNLVFDTTRTMLDELLEQLDEYGVDSQDIILKTNLLEFNRKQTAAEIALQSFELLKPWFQGAGGVKLLSGGQSADEAFSRTAELSKLVADEKWDMQRDFPRISTSFSRACMETVLETWKTHSRERAIDVFVALSTRNKVALGL